MLIAGPIAVLRRDGEFSILYYFCCSFVSMGDELVALS